MKHSNSTTEKTLTEVVNEMNAEIIRENQKNRDIQDWAKDIAISAEAKLMVDFYNSDYEIDKQLIKEHWLMAIRTVVKRHCTPENIEIYGNDLCVLEDFALLEFDYDSIVAQFRDIESDNEISEKELVI